MDSFATPPPALSIKQPWVDLILRRVKTIEVREWPVVHRGPLLIHASGTIDWKSIELLGYDNALALPRGGLVAVTEILDVVEFTRRTWLDLMPDHRVVHPPVREPVFGAMLGQVIPFAARIPCRGRPMLFPVPTPAMTRVRTELAALGLMGP